MMEQNSGGRSRILDQLQKYKYAALVLLAGFLLMLWPAGESGGGAADLEPSAQGSASDFDVTALERRMEEALSQISGVGEATVVLTLQTGPERVLASDWQQNGGQTEHSTVVVSRGSGAQEAVTLREIYPCFQGALVVCDGGENPSVQLRVLQSVAALTGLSSDKISICGRK